MEAQKERLERIRKQEEEMQREIERRMEFQKKMAEATEKVK